VGVTCLRPVESYAGVGDRDRAAEKAPNGDDRQTNIRDPSITCMLIKYGVVTVLKASLKEQRSVICFL